MILLGSFGLSKIILTIQNLKQLILGFGISKSKILIKRYFTYLEKNNKVYLESKKFGPRTLNLNYVIIVENYENSFHSYLT